MITSLFNQDFTILRNYPQTTNGIIENHYSQLGIAKGRISSPSYNERNVFQNRGMILQAVIYLDVYDYDEQRDLLIDSSGTKYDIKGLTAFRDGEGNIAYLKIPVTENQNISSAQSGSSGLES